MNRSLLVLSRKSTRLSRRSIPRKKKKAAVKKQHKKKPEEDDLVSIPKKGLSL